jgi:hypothetical protein
MGQRSPSRLLVASGSTSTSTGFRAENRGFARADVPTSKRRLIDHWGENRFWKKWTCGND